MKTVLAMLLPLVVISCVTKTETKPDGTVIVTKQTDGAVLGASVSLATFAVDRFSGK